MRRPPKKELTIAIIAVVILVAVIVLGLAQSSDNKVSHESGNNTSSQVSSDQDSDERKNNVSQSNIVVNNNSSKIIYSDIKNWQTPIINNYQDIVKNIPHSRSISASQMLLYTLLDNGIETVPTDIVIRNGSFQQNLRDNTMTYETTYIVDIPSIKQSYRIEDWWSPIEKYNAGGYTTVVTCLKQDEMIYPSFNCIDQIMKEKEYNG